MRYWLHIIVSCNGGVTKGNSSNDRNWISRTLAWGRDEGRQWLRLESALMIWENIGDNGRLRQANLFNPHGLGFPLSQYVFLKGDIMKNPWVTAVHYNDGTGSLHYFSSQVKALEFELNLHRDKAVNLPNLSSTITMPKALHLECEAGLKG